MVKVYEIIKTVLRGQILKDPKTENIYDISLLQDSSYPQVDGLDRLMGLPEKLDVGEILNFEINNSLEKILKEALSLHKKIRKRIYP